MSVGNSTQAVNFDRQDLTLVLGENLDLGGDGSRNGTGKTTIINALSYALYGQALTNIRKENLINKINSKNMLVTIDFEKDGIDYRIERGRKPGIIKFFVAGNEQEVTDEAQGDSRETQEAIEHILNMSHDMFQHITALNTYTQPFLSLKANEQRTIIEQLLGITLLSEKADRIKELKPTAVGFTQYYCNEVPMDWLVAKIREELKTLRADSSFFQDPNYLRPQKFSEVRNNLRCCSQRVINPRKNKAAHILAASNELESESKSIFKTFRVFAILIFTELAIS